LKKGDKCAASKFLNLRLSAVMLLAATSSLLYFAPLVETQAAVRMTPVKDWRNFYVASLTQ